MPGALTLYTREAQFVLVTIPVHIIMAYIPYAIRQIAILMMRKGFDNANPRLYIASLENEALSGNPAPLFALRAHGCHLNSIENLGFWIPAVLAALLYSTVPYLALIVAAIHLGLRFFYMLFYLFNSNKIVSYFRSLIWFFAWCCPLVVLWECVYQLRP